MSSDTTVEKPGEQLIVDLLDSLDKLFGLHPGFRPVHAKGVMCSGVFRASEEARDLTSAAHVQRESVPVVLRFSNFAGVPTIPDNDPNGAGPRGFALRFYLAEHEHTDIVGHSENGFPVRTGEEFLELARALASSGADAAKPTPLERFFQDHPRAKEFLEAPKPIPTSYAREAFFGVNAVRFINKNGVARYGRYKIRPEGGTEYLSASEAAAKSENFLADEMIERLKRGPVKMDVIVQLAGPNDIIDDASSRWSDTNTELNFGTIELIAPANDADPELRKIIFDPVPRLEGIEASNDPLIQVRSDIYLLSGRRRRAAAAQKA